MTCEIAVLRGDGIGPEVIESALSVLGACVPVRVHEGLVGGAAIDVFLPLLRQAEPRADWTVDQLDVIVRTAKPVAMAQAVGHVGHGRLMTMGRARRRVVVIPPRALERLRGQRFDERL